MFSDVVRPAHRGAEQFVQPKSPLPDAFERLPINLSAEEIRALVFEALG